MHSLIKVILFDVMHKKPWKQNNRTSTSMSECVNHEKWQTTSTTTSSTTSTLATTPATHLSNTSYERVNL